MHIDQTEETDESEHVASQTCASPSQFVKDQSQYNTVESYMSPFLCSYWL